MGRDDNDNSREKRIAKVIKNMFNRDVTVKIANAGGYDLSKYLDDAYKGYFCIEDTEYLNIVITSKSNIDNTAKDRLKHDWILDNDKSMNKKLKNIILEDNIPIAGIESESEKKKYLSNKVFKYDTFGIVEDENYIGFQYKIETLQS